MGTKFIGHDSGIFIIDFKNHNLFGILNERISRVKHDTSFIDECLEYLNKNNIKDIDCIVGSFNDFKKNSTTDIKYYYLQEVLKNLKISYGIKYLKEFEVIKNDSNINKFIKLLKAKKLRISLFLLGKVKLLNILNINSEFLNRKLINQYIKNKLKFYKLNCKEIDHKEHHLCHAVAAYFMSPYNKNKALVLVIDGQGDGKYHSTWIFDNKKYECIGESFVESVNNNAVSIGRIYSIFTEVLGFHANADEGKTEALAAFGNPDDDLMNLLNISFIIDEQLNGWRHKNI